MDHQHLKRLLIIVVLVSFIFSSGAQYAASTDQEDTSTDIKKTSDCNPKTGNCNVPKHTEPVTEEDSQDTTKYEPSTGLNERICKPGTTSTVCKEPEPDPKPTKKAVTDEDASNVEPNTICNPTTGLCLQGQYSGDADTVTSPIESSEKENASDSKHNPVNLDDCDPFTGHCTTPPPPGSDFVMPEPTKGDLPDSFKPNPINNIVCNPTNHKCGQPKPQLLASESGKAAQIEDSIIQEQQKAISPLVCTINADGSEDCAHNHPSDINNELKDEL